MKKIKPYLIYSLVSGIIMLSAMLIGEYFYGPIFNGFLQKPVLWPLAFIETIIWVIPITWLSAVVLNRLPAMTGGGLFVASMLFWATLSVGVFVVYQIATDSRLPIWNEAKLSPQYLLGWYLPGLVIIISFSLLSPLLISDKKGHRLCKPLESE